MPFDPEEKLCLSITYAREIGIAWLDRGVLKVRAKGWRLNEKNEIVVRRADVDFALGRNPKILRELNPDRFFF